VAEARQCSAPATMLYAPTYTDAVRIRISSLAPLPTGWKVDHPHLTSAFYDMLMSRWLDDETVASWGAEAAGTAPAAQALTARFTGSMVLLFGESTMTTGSYTATIDGVAVTEKVGDQMVGVLNPGNFGRACGGNVHLVKVLATGLDSAKNHVLVITPQPNAAKLTELRLESICVAGPGARVVVGP
jgi:hypothetical protein